MTKVIEITNVVKKYKEVTAVNQLNLTIQKGEIYGLLGPNGAGKSTTIFMLLGLTEPTEGELFIEGISPTKRPIEVKKKVGFLPDHVGVYEDLSGFENIILTARLNGFTRKEAELKADELLQQVGLSHAKHKKAGKYSRGMKQRLGLADTLIKEPSIVIMDEPTLGIDPKGIQEFLQMIKELSVEKGITILLSSHHLHQVQQICDRVGIFVKGELLAEGDLDTLQQQLLDKHTFQYEIDTKESSDRVESFLQTKYPKLRTSVYDGKLHVTTKQKDNGNLVKTLINDGGFHLLSFRPMSYGLDDIYQQYFQGGDDLGSREG
ncbi:ABC transporter ATP-binding protein [Piscibacillus halophilus]|uniref:ABC transporter ATP-binding protein n=1 Tax=Piscibacillus halophilus TaxID=571933 RepID=UPI00158C9787|nr:ABC transporter ATP-binding protein [Piscibacillus halophilus]